MRTTALLTIALTATACHYHHDGDDLPWWDPKGWGRDDCACELDDDDELDSGLVDTALGSADTGAVLLDIDVVLTPDEVVRGDTTILTLTVEGEATTADVLDAVFSDEVVTHDVVLGNDEILIAITAGAAPGEADLTLDLGDLGTVTLDDVLTLTGPAPSEATVWPADPWDEATWASLR